jgi:hypothetical protein
MDYNDENTPNQDYIHEADTIKKVMAAGGYINNIPVLYDSNPESEDRSIPDMGEYNLYVGTYSYNGQLYDRWIHHQNTL